MPFSPVAYDLDAEAVRFGADEAENEFSMALAAGRVVATVVSERTGKHVSVQLRAKCREAGKKRFRACDLADAQRVYIDVPSSEGGGAEIGCLHLEGRWSGKILPPWDKDFDGARLWAARRVLDVAHGRAAVADDKARILEGKFCLLCGRELTDPESIARNIGPDCWRKVTGQSAATGEHQREGEQISLEEQPSAAEVGEAAMEREHDAASAREEIEAELQQTIRTREDGDGNGDLDADPGSEDGLILLREGDDPREVLRGRDA